VTKRGRQALEQRRLELQAGLDSAKSQAARNRLGQFATPTDLATDILSVARRLLAPESAVRFLDPAFGTGAFYSALLRSFPATRIDWARGYEIDPHYAEPTRQLWEGTPLALTLGDFTAVRPPSEEKDKATLLVCNPPYVRHHHLTAEAKARLRAASLGAANMDLNGLAGLYCYFIALSHAWMAKDAVAIWLVPSEFMDVNYGRALREYLLSQVTLLRVHRFDPGDVQFCDALVSSAVVVFRNTKPSSTRTTEFSFGGMLAKPSRIRIIETEQLRAAPKWARISRASDERVDDDGDTRVGDLFTIRRGIATGANDFFLIPEPRAKELGLPPRFLRPILPSPRLLRTDEIEADRKGNPLIEPRLFLLDCQLPEPQVRHKYRQLWAYLETGRARGIHERYLCTHRRPWYAQESRAPAPILCTYMGRTGQRRSPFRFILNRSKAIAANVYLMLYPKPALAAAFRRTPGALSPVWAALREIPWAALLGVGRVYGGGLHKMEPNELAHAPGGRVLAALPEAAAPRAKQLRLTWQTP
jgi:hypothetical protein